MKLNSPSFALLLASSLCLGACDKSSRRAADTPTAPSNADGVPSGEENATAPEPDDREPAAPTIAVAEEPAIALVDNRYRFHLYRDGLIIPFASEGFRKYTQEYRQPFEEVVEVDGRAGRVLDRRAADLTIPWPDDSAATARLWVHGLGSGQKVQLDVNGKRAGVATVGDGWTTVDFEIGQGQLRAGENALQLHASRAGTAAGSRSWGLYHAMEIVSLPGAPKDAPPPLTPQTTASFGGEEKRALSGLERMELYVEIPESGWLQLETGADEATDFSVIVRGVEGEERTILDLKAGKTRDSNTHLISLEDWAGELVVLELASDGGAWLDPQIVLREARVKDRLPAAKNVILLVIDALRSDRMALYGDTRVNTPRMTAAGKNAVVYLHNQAASPSSPPSHGSIQTGMIPRVHGVAGDKGRLNPGTPMISTQLGEADIATAYFGNNPFGMGRLEEPGKWTAFHQPNKEGKGIDCTVLMDEMLKWAESQNKAGKRFFISSLPYEPHTPYRYHEGISEKYWDGGWGGRVGKSVTGYLLNDIASGKVVLNDDEWKQLKALYDGEIEHMDNCFGQLEDGLAKLGLSDDTAIVLTSDHGEGMFEHGRMGHAYGHYSELTDVPLVLYVPGLVDDGPRKLHTVTSHLDIAPTVLDLMGVEPSEKIQGESVVPIALRQGPWTPRVMSTEYGKSFSLRAQRWRLIVDYGGQESLFDLQNDPTEQKEVAANYPIAHRYLRDLTGFFLARRSDWRMSTWGSLNNHDKGFLAAVEGSEQ